MSLSVLAQAIYAILRKRVPDPSPRALITYEDLVTQLGPMPPPNQDLRYKDFRLDKALGELVIACRKRGLPAISALVIRKDKDKRNPGDGYYPLAHPAEWAKGPLEAEVAWAQELIIVQNTAYPPKL